jgi:D-3-phosphoglycerate dehydrogenase
MAKVFLTHTPHAFENYYGERALAGLRSVAEVKRNPAERELDVAELIEAARDCDVIVSYRGTPGSAALFDGLPNLVAFSRCAIDIRNVDVETASRNGILVTQASAGFIASVSEWVIGAMVDLGRGLTRASEAYHAGTVPPALMGSQLAGSTVGVIGYGQISRYLCDLLVALGMRVLVSDPYAKVPSGSVSQVELPQLLGESDYVICLAIANAATENLMNADALSRMRRGAFFINASRGNLVDEKALADALDRGHIAGFAMDVGRAPDQMPSPSLAGHPRVIATPHVAGLTPQAIEHQSLETVGQVTEILKGRAPKGSVNADRATRLARIK